MQLLSRHIGREVWRWQGLTALVLFALFSLLELIEQLSRVGDGSYTLDRALQFVLMTAPGRLVEQLLTIVLLGSALGLGVLAANREIIAARALGTAAGDITRAVLRASLAGIGLALIVVEFVTPKLDESAWLMRTASLADHAAFSEPGGYWARDGWRFVNIRDFRFGRIPLDIDIYQFAPAEGLVRFIHAREAEIVDEQNWLLEDVVIKEVRGPLSSTTHHDRWRWTSFLPAAQLGVLEMPPESLAPSSLWGYIQSLKTRGQAYDRYELALWRKISLPFGALVMALLAVPVAFGGGRGGKSGQRLFLAALLGLLFVLVNQAAGYLGLLAAISPVVTTFAPIAALLLVALVLVGRLE